jgi:hypothetical protein
MIKRHKTAKQLFSYPLYWAECYGVSPFLPTTREEMDALGWDSCDVIIVSGDAYVDHPSFGMAVLGIVSGSLISQTGAILKILCALVAPISILVLPQATWIL